MAWKPKASKILLTLENGEVVEVDVSGRLKSPSQADETFFLDMEQQEIIVDLKDIEDEVDANGSEKGREDNQKKRGTCLFATYGPSGSTIFQSRTQGLSTFIIEHSLDGYGPVKKFPLQSCKFATPHLYTGCAQGNLNPS